MKWEAAPIRRSAASHRSRAVSMSPRRPRCGRARRGRRPRPGRRPGAVPASRIARAAAPRRRPASAASIAASRHSPSAACSPPPAARCQAVAASSAARAGPVCPSRAQDAPEVDPGERGQAHVTGGFGLARSRAPAWRRRSRSRRPGTGPGRGWRVGTPRSAGSRDVRDVSAARPMWTTASSKRCWIRASSPSIASRRTCSHGSSTVRSQCSTCRRASTLRSWSPAEIAARAAKSQFAA